MPTTVINKLRRLLFGCWGTNLFNVQFMVFFWFFKRERERVVFNLDDATYFCSYCSSTWCIMITCSLMFLKLLNKCSCLIFIVRLFVYVIFECEPCLEAFQEISRKFMEPGWWHITSSTSTKRLFETSSKQSSFIDWLMIHSIFHELQNKNRRKTHQLWICCWLLEKI